jgi:heptosyltransferase-2
MMRTLVIAPQWIGDAVMSEPLLAALAARGDTVSVAALPSIAPVVRAMPEVAEVIELPFAHGRLDLAARWRLARTLRGRFDRAIVLPNSFKAALLPWFAGIRERWGYVGEARRVLLTRTWPDRPNRPPMVQTYGALSGGGLADDAAPRLALAASTIDAALRTAELQRDAYWAFAPGAEFGPSKRWPAGHYAALARELHDRSGLPVVLLGSRAETALCEQVAAAAGGACRVLAGRTALLDAIALVAAARALLSNDSGLMHVAAAFGVPQVAVFGSTSPEHTPPLSRRARVLWLKDELGLTCMPCFERTCRYGHTRCLVGVTPDRVEAALRDALASAPTSAKA